MQTHRVRPSLAMALAAALTCAHVAQAAPLPASQWRYRTPVALANSFVSTAQTNFPVLVKLDSGNFDFSKANADGSDIRFLDSDSTALSYQIEKWDSTGQQAVVWVKVPKLDRSTKADHLLMVHGNPTAADAQNPADVWSNGYVGVWHLGDDVNDSTSFDNDGTITGGVSLAPGPIGDGRAFDGTGYIAARNANASLDAGDNITITYWMQADGADNANFQRNLAKAPGAEDWEYQRNGTSAGMSIRIDTDPGAGGLANQCRNIGTAYDGDWHFVGVTASSGDCDTYFDATSHSYTYLHANGFGNTSPMYIGSRTGGALPFTGQFDEMRFSHVARSDLWMRAEYRSQSGQLSAVGTTVDRLGAPNTGLIAQYTHELADPLTDVTGNAYHATNHGGGGGVAFVAPPTTQGFQLGDVVGSYNRNQSRYLEVPSHLLDIGQSFTFTAAVWRDSSLVSGHQTILACDRFRFQWSADGYDPDKGRLRIDINGSGDTTTAPGVFDLDTWYFVALRYDAATNQANAFLVDGVDLGSPAFSFSPGPAFDYLGGLRIGADGLSGIGSFDGWTGYIDGARFYGSYLGDDQLQAVLAQYIPEPATLGLLGLGALALLRRRRRTT